MTAPEHAGLIDCDIHQANPTEEVLAQTLREPYRSEVARFGVRKLASGHRVEDGGSRGDLTGPDAKGLVGDPRFVAVELLDRYGQCFGLLSGSQNWTAGIPDPDYAAAICSAINDHTLDVWLPADDRYVMSIMLPLQDPQLAVREIERLSTHPRVVAASFFATANTIAFGERYYWPIYQACQRHDLPIHIHPSTTATLGNTSDTPAGRAGTYFEMHVCLPQFYMAQTASLVLRGVFEQFPRLKVILVEGGIAWLPHLLWRMDSEFKGLRHETPYLKRMPSEYVHDHVRLTTQPLEDPGNWKHLQQIYEMVDAENTVMYASDFPHWDFDEPQRLPKILGARVRQRILYDNASEWLGLSCTRDHDHDKGLNYGSGRASRTPSGVATDAGTLPPGSWLGAHGLA